MKTREHRRLQETHSSPVPPWRHWGPYVSERAWGTVREDYSAYGTAWDYFPLDSTPTHSYMKYLYKYPQAPFPYTKLIDENGRRRGQQQPEYELIDTGVFDDDRYFDVF